MTFARLVLAVLSVAGASDLCAQALAPIRVSTLDSSPLIVDVHPSPYRKTINYKINLSRQRFDMRHATIVDLIEFAYVLGEQDDDRGNPAIVGGMPWIEFDRFDVAAKIPALPPAPDVSRTIPASPLSDSYDRIRPLLKRVLAERFHLLYHREDRPLPGYVMTVANGGAKLTETKNPATTSECKYASEKAMRGQFTLTCTSETVAHLTSSLGNVFPHPITDRTGLTKRYDFTLKLVQRPEVRTRDDLARVYIDAFSKQLGLVVTRGDVPQPAFVIDAVDHVPTPTAPEIAKQIPTLPELEFEVASIRPASVDEPQAQIRALGSQITFSAMEMSDLITRAWQLPTAAMLGDSLALLPRTRFTILVKLPPDVDSEAVYRDPDEIANMLQKLLIDRFKVSYHWGEWTQSDAFVLLAGTPKMKKALPTSRSFCKFGPVEGEKTARGAGSQYDGEFHCQNVTMAQFADLVQPLAQADVKNRVPDKTGLAGAYDFSVYFTVGRTLRTRTAAAALEAKQNPESMQAPVAGLSVEDAFRKQLGLRLEKQPLVLPALILDHFEAVPTEN